MNCYIKFHFQYRAVWCFHFCRKFYTPLYNRKSYIYYKVSYMLRHRSWRNRTNVLKRSLCPIWCVFPDTLSPYLIRGRQIFQSSAFSNSLLFCIPISAIAAAVIFGLNGGASTFNSFSFSRLISQFSSKG